MMQSRNGSRSRVITSFCNTELTRTMNQTVTLTLLTDSYVLDISIIVDTLLLRTTYSIILVHFLLNMTNIFLSG